MSQGKAIEKGRTVVAATLLLVIWTCSSLIACDKARRPTRYLIPQGYIGWLAIDFKVKAAQPLAIEDNRYLVRFPSTGRTETSSEVEYGVGPVDEYYYYSDKNRLPLELGGTNGQGMIWGEHNGSRYNSSNELTETYEAFFVGTYDDYRSYGWCAKEDDGYPKIGPLDKRVAVKCNGFP